MNSCTVTALYRERTPDIRRLAGDQRFQARPSRRAVSRPLLDAAVVAYADDLAAMDDNRTDWDAAFVEPLPGSLYCRFEK
jgi:hypothetical protein